MAYKSNKQALAEYLENKARNSERNRRNYERRTARAGKRSKLGKVLLLTIGLFLLIQYFKHRPTPAQTQTGTFVSAHARP